MKVKVISNTSSGNIIKVIGVGGGGSNAVNNMFNEGIVGVDFAICNTDHQAMDISPVPLKIQLGPQLTEGRGAGSKPLVGREACLESIEEVKSYLNGNTKMLFIAAGLGGGTGTGAAPIIAKAAQELDILTVGIVTLPFAFEGRRRHQQAMEGLEELKKNVDTLVVISNEKMSKVYANFTLNQAFLQADNILTTAARGIAEAITKTGFVNVDFEDVNTVMRGSGVAVMGTAAMEGQDRGIRAVEAALQCPLLEESEIVGAKHILVNITTGARDITMEEINGIMDYVAEQAGKGTDLIWGACTDPALGEKLMVTVIATGFETGRQARLQSTLQQQQANTPIVPKASAPREPQRTRVSLDDSLNPPSPFPYTSPQAPSTQERDDISNVFEFDVPSVSNTIKPNDLEEQAAYKTEKPAFHPEERYRQLEKLDGKINSTQYVNDMENEPAYLRRKVRLSDTPPAQGNRLSSWVLTDDEQPEFRRNNSFLHDNVD